MSDICQDGIHGRPSETAKTTGKRLIIERTAALDQAIEQVKAASPKCIAPWLFVTRASKPYMDENGVANAFDSLWQPFMDKALKEIGLKEQFQ